MAVETIEAVYERGGFRPVFPEKLHFADGQKVRLVVERMETPEEILALATEVYEGLSETEVEEIERHAVRRGDFFGNGISE
jgi:predicted DNA-binding antitoxin AbrB/MazE fold protein